MDRSLGFGSTPSNYRPYQTRFPYASPIRLSSLLNVSRWPIIQKVRSHPVLQKLCFWSRRQRTEDRGQIIRSGYAAFIYWATKRLSSKSVFCHPSSVLCFTRKALEAPGSHCLYACGFRIYFTPLPGFFSPFPHGTGSLSVDYEYLALEDGPPIFKQDFTCPALLISILVLYLNFRLRDYHPLRFNFPENLTNSNIKYWRLIPVRSPLLWESRLISFPLGT